MVLPSENVTRFDVNYGNVSGGGFPGGNAGGDWFHCNGLDHDPDTRSFDAELSQLECEFYIIDHGTTSEEAAGPAGDLLYRWGNPQTYGRGDEEDQVFFQQHDAHWLLDEGTRHQWWRPCSNCTRLQQRQWTARRNREFSGRIDPAMGQRQRGIFAAFSHRYRRKLLRRPDSIGCGPKTQARRFTVSNISGSQRQPNGNTLICEGSSGHLFEITPEGEIVWEYITAYSQFGAGDSR